MSPRALRPAPAADGGDGPASAPDTGSADAIRVVDVRNPMGMHARPASLIVRAARGAELWLRRLPDGDPVPASSMMRLLASGAQQGDEIELRGDPETVDRVAALFESGFGELPEAPQPG